MKRLILTAVCALAVAGPAAGPSSAASRDGVVDPGSVIICASVIVSNPDFCAAACVWVCEVNKH